MRPGQPERHTHDYFRHGTMSLFPALNVATGEVIGRCHRRDRHQEFLRFLEQIYDAIPEEPGVSLHLVLDNYVTHKTPKVKRWFAWHPRFHVHFTPTGVSWLNQVARFFAAITQKRIRRSVFRSVRQLERSIIDYVANHNENPRPFVWTAEADSILAKVARLCKRINDSGH